MTRQRIATGRCIVAAKGGKLLGTGLYKAPGRSKGTPHFASPGVASIHQFAVAPEYQAQGLGARLLAFTETAARGDGAAALALDTSEGAAALIAWYRKRGFDFVEYAQWSGKTYRSVILSKSL